MVNKILNNILSIFYSKNRIKLYVLITTLFAFILRIIAGNNLGLDPDDANHAQEGIFVWKIPGKKWDKKEDVISIYDIAPSILKFYGIDIPENMVGKPLI